MQTGLENDKNDTHCYVLMDFIPGGSIWDHVCHYGPLRELYARVLFDQLLSGLEYMHNSGYAHRDIKP